MNTLKGDEYAHETVLCTLYNVFTSKCVSINTNIEHYMEDVIR